VTGFPAEPMLRQLLAALAPGRTLPATAATPDPRRFSWGVEQEYRNAEGDVISIGEQCVNSALPGENVDTVYSLRLGEELTVWVVVAQDYGQDTLVFELDATEALIDRATEALLRVAAGAGLVRVRSVR